MILQGGILSGSRVEQAGGQPIGVGEIAIAEISQRNPAQSLGVIGMLFYRRLQHVGGAGGIGLRQPALASSKASSKSRLALSGNFFKVPRRCSMAVRA